MPDCPHELVGTWIQSSLNNYRNDGTVERVKQLIDIAAAFKTERDVPLFCGEFGVYIPNSDNNDRVYWYNIVRNYLEEKGIAWTIWDYRGGFGLFKAGTSEMFDYDLNIPLLDTLGFNSPPQFEFVLKPDTTRFDLYMDFIGQKIVESSWADEGIVNFYSEDNPVGGNYCIYWTEFDQYNYIGFNFKPIKDLSMLVDNGYAIDFWVRGDSPGARFDIRFVDTKTDAPGDHPWRMRMTIDETLATWNGEWNHLQIPLSDFTEHGSWDNEWFEPQGDFDWTAIEHFQIVSEHHDLKGIKFWFDNIRIVDPQVVGVQSEVGKQFNYKLFQNYPNPFNPVTTIVYELNETSTVSLKVYNLTGCEVGIIGDNQQKEAGHYQVTFDGSDLPNGVYFYRLDTNKQTMARKMLLIK